MSKRSAHETEDAPPTKRARTETPDPSAQSMAEVKVGMKAAAKAAVEAYIALLKDDVGPRRGARSDGADLRRTLTLESQRTKQALEHMQATVRSIESNLNSVASSAVLFRRRESARQVLAVTEARTERVLSITAQLKQHRAIVDKDIAAAKAMKS